MNITITARKTSVRDSFKDRIDKKLAKLDRFFDESANAIVTVTNEGDRETVEVTIQAQGLFRQIVKNKDKLGKRLRETAFDAANMEAGEEQEEAYGDFDVKRVKRFTLRPMDIDEAILQMNLVEHEFFVFLNAESNEINVVYKRRNGAYGLLEPTIE